MANTKVTFDSVRKIGLTLPGVEDGSTYKAAALKVGKKLLAWIPSHKSAEADSFAIRLDDEDRAALIAESPETYYVPEHYADYNAVLIRMSRLSPTVLRDLLGMSHRFVTRKGGKK